ncbi:bacillolysin [Bacillus sp. AFS094611]|uniref:Bacillolysin n=2 Tax=Bacillus cereus group TaxID=86661 RepID=A0A2A7DG23_BACAN|nr:bacillolysin [Bacillus thuringiensis serovar coreanensis]OTX45908.1 bacillolysin [Bacillus thuringiensis serovar sooncheon]OTX49053.1 bacillolysin [Bacillus thuringiensis serovar guiyangiensis]OTX64074.1 bacillolysin [Bacillus thuringiensis serovar roskildiensis]PDZ18953.1 bacillolysin [Bacillus anthracis]PDZ51578.1 bacillolysin [Bacillus sp. AFS094611]
MNYRKLARAFITFGLLYPLSTEAFHTQELDKNEIKVGISQPSLMI